MRFILTILFLLVASPSWAAIDRYFTAGTKIPLTLVDSNNRGVMGPLTLSHFNVKARCTSSNSGSTVTVDETEAEVALTWIVDGSAELAIGDNQAIGSVIGETCEFWVEAVGDGIGQLAAVPTTVLSVPASGYVRVDLDNSTGTLDAAQFGSDFLTAAKIAPDAFGASEVAADFFSELLNGVGGIYGTLSAGSTGTSLISSAFVGTDTSDYVGWVAVANSGASVITTFNPATDTVTLAASIGTVATGNNVWLIPNSLWELLTRMRSRQ